MQVHLFGRGAAVLRGALTGPGHLILSTAPCATLDRLCLDNQAGASAVGGASPGGHSGHHHSSNAVRVVEGHLRLQECSITLRNSNGYACVHATGLATQLDVVGGVVRGGKNGIRYNRGAGGRVDGCLLTGAIFAGIYVWGAGSSPVVTRTAIQACGSGVRVDAGVDADWAVGEGVVFHGCQHSIIDERASTEHMPDEDD